jgi:chromosomal replication initiation ATPase DnaA
MVRMNTLAVEFRDEQQYTCTLHRRLVAENAENCIGYVVGVVCGAFRISVEAMMGQGQCFWMAGPRHVAMTLAYEAGKKYQLTQEEIATAFNRKNRATVKHAIKATQDRCDTEPEFRATVEALRERIKQQETK